MRDNLFCVFDTSVAELFLGVLKRKLTLLLSADHVEDVHGFHQPEHPPPLHGGHELQPFGPT